MSKPPCLVSREALITLQPSRANSSTKPRPIPPLPPVMMT